MGYRDQKTFRRGLAGAVRYSCRRYRWGPVGLLLVIGLGSLTACETKPEYRDVERYQPLRIGILPDTQGEGSTVSVHPMRAVLEKLQGEGADIVIAVGDLTNHGTSFEFDQWTEIASAYRDSGIEFLPLMGNHETSYAYTVEWIDAMKGFIPVDAVHMGGAEYHNYYVIRENALIVLLKYGDLPVAFRWIQDVVNRHREEVDHIIMASHDGLIGAKYGQTRERIVQGIRGDDLLMDQWEEIRSFFARHDVIWVQGHEHMYQRSVITAPVHVDPVSWSVEDGNYRMPGYTQIIAGNASYKGYEFRYGERERVQRVVQQKMNTMENGSEAFDANASLLTLDNSRIDYRSWAAEHTVRRNEEGPGELAEPEWILIDTFSRTTDRCEQLVYPNSIPASTRPVLHHEVRYRTSECRGADGSVARLVDGINDTFNRVESTTREISYTPGFSRAESSEDLARLAFQYLFQRHQPWTPNLNRDVRVEVADQGEGVVIPETTIDLKEHVTLSWLPANGATLSDRLIVSGTQMQTGVSINAWGGVKDMEREQGLARSGPDGERKAPHRLPETASGSWDLATAVSDAYVLQFDGGPDVDADRVELAYFAEDSGEWTPFTRPECVVHAPYEEGLMNRGHPEQQGYCEGEPLVGFDSDRGDRWWVVLQSDTEVALVSR